MALFFSEYIEGSSNNKALEIYNDTGTAIDLATAGYVVQMYFNGNSTPGLTIPLTGTVANGDVKVVLLVIPTLMMLLIRVFNGTDLPLIHYRLYLTVKKTVTASATTMKFASGQNALVGGNGSDLFILNSSQGVDIITDFNMTQDSIGLADNLTFAQLTIIHGIDSNDYDTIISFLGEAIAIITGIQATTLASNNFISI